MQSQRRAGGTHVFDSGAKCLNCKRDVGLSRLMLTNVFAFEPSSWKPTGCWSARQVKHSPSCRRRRHAHHKCKKRPLCGRPCEAVGVAKRRVLRTKTMHSSLHVSFQMLARSPHVGFSMQFCSVVRHAEFIAWRFLRMHEKGFMGLLEWRVHGGV